MSDMEKGDRRLRVYSVEKLEIARAENFRRCGSDRIYHLHSVCDAMERPWVAISVRPCTPPSLTRPSRPIRARLFSSSVETEFFNRIGRKQPPALASGELPESWLGTVGTALVVVARHEGAALAHEKVEIGAFVRLQHVIEIEAPVAACQRRLGLFPFPAPLREFLLRHEQLELSLRDVELDFVAV